MPATERLRIAHPGAAMLTVAASFGTGCTLAAVTDGGVVILNARSSAINPKGSVSRAAGLCGLCPLGGKWHGRLVIVACLSLTPDPGLSWAEVLPTDLRLPLVSVGR
jgi:hypothetical protein